MKNPYQIVKCRHITEKATVLEQLQNSESNRSARRCQTPKAIFIVDVHANKIEIKEAVEEIYREQNVSVAKVNTIRIKPKAKRRGRGRRGATAGFKKAVVSFAPGDSIDNL